jgi:hypothetical protein
MEYLVDIGGDDTLSYGVHLFIKGVKVIAIPTAKFPYRTRLMFSRAVLPCLLQYDRL